MVFILSGLLKLYPIEPFENLLVAYHLTNFLIAPFLARFLIGLELLIGLYFLFSASINKKVWLLTNLFLALLTVFLIVQLAFEGNQGNCGCFGEIISLTPLESIFKNLVLFVLLFLSKKGSFPYVFKYKLIFALLLLAIAFATPYLLNPVGLNNVQSTEINQKIDLSELPPVENIKNQPDFKNKNYVLAFLSTTCPHCKIAAGRLSVYHRNGAKNLIYVIAGKDEALYDEFISSTKSEGVPVIRFYDETFFKYSGGKLPAIIYVEKSVLKKKWTGEFFDAEEVASCLVFD